MLEKIAQKVEKGDIIAPFLFTSQNLEILHTTLHGEIRSLLQENNIDIQSLFHSQDIGESLKIAEIKSFLLPASTKPRFAFQVFFIENISRMTTQAQNACLKFFEEPGKGNIVILTSQSEAGILETILSRLQIISQNNAVSSSTDTSFYYSMIESHINKSSDELVRYFFSGKYEKEEYMSFLKAFLTYIQNTGEYIYMLGELEEDMQGIMNNNLQGRYIIDKYIMTLGAN